MKALISVSNKSNIVTFAKQLIEYGYDIISTGGTLKTLTDNRVPATSISDYTHFPEILSGRVKTLHPKVHGAILADRSKKDHLDTCDDHGIDLFDMVVVNLYPFEQTIQDPSKSESDAIENIDIGGPTLIRAAAKNYKHVTVVVEPHDYEVVITDLKENNGKIIEETRKQLATTAFMHVAQYDVAIANYFVNNQREKKSQFPELITTTLKKVNDLRYGENPHQNAAYYNVVQSTNGNAPFEQLHGKELSYNNIIDIAAALNIVSAFDIPAASIIKHTNPCGAAVADDIKSAYKKAYESDPISAFGSIVGLNKSVDEKTAQVLNETFIEVIIAPEFDSKALDILTKKKSLRLIKASVKDCSNKLYYKYINNSFLIQSLNQLTVNKDDLTGVTKKKVKNDQINDMLFAFNLVRFVKSNAILIAKDGQTIGIGAGQMSRVDAVEIALKKAGKNAEGAVLASDAFFPFKDSVELAAKYKISAIVQPGGSKRDQESIEACNDHDIAMMFTGSRHFLH